MRIHSLKYHDKASNWKLDNIKFSDLTLLVGASGVGKTKILKAVHTLSKFSLSRKKQQLLYIFRRGIPSFLR